VAHSTRAGDSPKARKPHKTSDSLTARADGRWCKRYKDNTGTWKWFYCRGTEQEALDEWNRVKADLLAGREPDAPPSDPNAVVTLANLVNAFLHHKKQVLDSGELSPRTWQGYEAVGKMLLEFFGRHIPADKIKQPDFQRLRAHLASKYGPVALGNRIQVVRMIFRYGLDSERLATPAKFGVEFNKPSAKTLRLVRESKGQQVYTPEQIQSLLKAADAHMKAMVLLACNGGLGNTDIALLTPDSFDLDGGWLDYRREKTGVPRRIPLWPETVAAIRRVIETRRQAKNPAEANLLFIGARGTSYVNHTGGHRVAAEFARLRDDVGIKGRVFYDFRRTFQTVAENLSRDKDTVKAIMGHTFSESDMAARYRQGFYDDRLQDVVNHVRSWLFGKRATAGGTGTRKRREAASKPKVQRHQSATAGKRRATAEIRTESFALRIVG
jgi:integrase